MITPNLPIGRWIDEQGYPTPEMMGVFAQLVTELQNNLSNEGYKVPQQPTANVQLLNTAQSEGALLYDSDTKELKVNINGTFKTVQVV
jgi:hypothetical protein